MSPGGFVLNVVTVQTWGGLLLNVVTVQTSGGLILNVVTVQTSGGLLLNVVTVQTPRHVHLAKCRSCDNLACTYFGAGGILFDMHSET